MSGHRSFCLVLVALLLFTSLGTAMAAAPAQGDAAKEIVFMDNQSGANFQQWFQTIALPAARRSPGHQDQVRRGPGRRNLREDEGLERGPGRLCRPLPQVCRQAHQRGQDPARDTQPGKDPQHGQDRPVLQKSTEGVEINNKAVAYWYSTYALVYNCELRHEAAQVLEGVLRPARGVQRARSASSGPTPSPALAGGSRMPS